MGFRFNPRPFRWLALAGMIAVLGATLSSFLTRTRERPQPRPAPETISPQISQQTQAFTLSKTSGDHTLYTVQAKEVTHFKDKVVLHGVSILLYGKEGGRHDIIETEECEFDPAAKSLRIPGEVIMTLGIPPPDPKAKPQAARAPAKDPDSVNIITTGLVFDQANGIASTDQEVRFQFTQGSGTAKGAVYDPETQQLTLRSAVQFVLSEPSAGSASTSGNAPAKTNIRAGSLRFQRGDSVVYLAGPVELIRGSRTLRAGKGEIFLDENRQARRVQLEDRVSGVDRSDGQMANLRAESGLLELSEQGRLSSLHLEGQVEWSASAAGPGADHGPLREGHARDAQLFFTHPAGLLDRIVATGNVQMVLRDPRTAPPKSARSSRTQGRTFAGPAGGQTRTLVADRIEMKMTPDGKLLQHVSARPNSTLDLVPFDPEEQRWRITGREFEMSFDPSGNLTQFAAEQTVQVSAEPQRGSADRKLSTSDHLTATVDPRTRSLSRIEQWGRYQYQDSGKQTRADRAQYSAEEEVVMLRGGASVWNPRGKLSADQITMHNSTGQIQAEGRISTTFIAEGSPGMNPSSPDLPVQAVSDRLQYDAAAGKARYEGRVRLWQGNNLLQADRVDLDRGQRQLEAEGKVYSVLPQSASGLANQSKTSSSAGPGSPKDGEPVEIRSLRMVYKDTERRAEYQGEARMRSGSSEVNAEHLEIFLAPATASPSDAGAARIERVVAQGGVVILGTGKEGKSARKATADRAEYFPEQSLFHLFGKPAVVRDPQKGSIQGVRLTYRVADDRILVEGEPGLPAETRRQEPR